MLTGKRAFDGAEVTDVLARVIEREPDFRALPVATPPTIHKLLRRCLEKDRNKRLPDIGVARLDIDEALTRTPEAPVSITPLKVRPPGWRRMATLGLGFVATAVVAGAAVWIAMRPAPPRVVRTEITTSGAAALNLGGINRSLAVTPDGSRILYYGAGQTLVRAVDQLDPTPLRGLGNAFGLFASPDGRWVGFFDSNTLKKVPITGGPPVTLCVVPGVGRGATWGADGTIIFAASSLGPGLERVSASGGAPVVLTKPNGERGEGDHAWPEFLPGNHAVLFTITPLDGSMDNSQVAVLDLRTGAQKVLIRGGSQAHYVSSGHLVYMVTGTLLAVAFDLERLEVTGSSIPVVPQVAITPLGVANFDVAENGTLVYLPASAATASIGRTLAWVDRQGREEPIDAPLRAYLYPRLSPDGTGVALAIRDQQNDIWVWDLARHTLTRITVNPQPDSYPVWTADGQRLIFGSASANGQVNLFWQAADGSGTAERLTESSNPQQPLSASPDGSRVVFREGVPRDLMVLLLGKDRRAEPLLRTPFNEINAEVSPDGRWLAYESNESGQQEVYVRPFPNVAGGRWQVSTGGGTRPLWARNGQELFYLAVTGSDTTLMSVRVQRGTTWTAGTPTKLFVGRFFYDEVAGQLGQGRTCDVAPDGQRFLMVKQGSGTAPAPANIVVVQNWTEELKRLVPTN